MSSLLLLSDSIKRKTIIRQKLDVHTNVLSLFTYPYAIWTCYHIYYYYFKLTWLFDDELMKMYFYKLLFKKAILKAQPTFMVTIAGSYYTTKA